MHVSRRRDLAHWTRDRTLFGTDKDNIAQPFLGEERLLDYVASLTGYINMLRTGFPDNRFLAVHTMPQRNPRQGALPSSDSRAYQYNGRSQSGSTAAPTFLESRRKAFAQLCFSG